MIGLSHYLIISAIIFSIGLIGVLRRRNLLMLFFATEVMLNAVNIAFAAISLNLKMKHQCLIFLSRAKSILHPTRQSREMQAIQRRMKVE